mmetsp:Transcript_5932/g.10617  ORF Transcript_5932/g.10617 Transcript_5932/m.10617 type:complete len:89 (+) Transcript_5932:263-529(+)
MDCSEVVGGDNGRIIFERVGKRTNFVNNSEPAKVAARKPTTALRWRQSFSVNLVAEAAVALLHIPRGVLWAWAMVKSVILFPGECLRH